MRLYPESGIEVLTGRGNGRAVQVLGMIEAPFPFCILPSDGAAPKPSPDESARDLGLPHLQNRDPNKSLFIINHLTWILHCKHP